MGRSKEAKRRRAQKRDQARCPFVVAGEGRCDKRRGHRGVHTILVGNMEFYEHENEESPDDPT